MKTRHHTGTINGKPVHGQGHLQPDINQWIGVFIATDDLLEHDIEEWKSVVIEYEGPFMCENECTNGKGKAKIMHVRRNTESNKLIINVQGVEDPVLDKTIDKNAQFHYNTNLLVNQDTSDLGN